MHSFFTTSLGSLKGVGPLAEKYLKKKSLVTFWDACLHIPSRYDIYESKNSLLEMDEKRVILGVTFYSMIGKKPWRFLGKTFQNEAIEIVFFSQPFSSFIPSSSWIVRGKLQYQGGRYTLVHPFLTPWNPGQPLPKDEIVPHYSLPAGLSSQRFQKWIGSILLQWPNSFNEPFPSPLCLRDALKKAHFPVSREDASDEALWRKKLGRDEYSAYLMTSWSQENFSGKSTPLCAKKGKKVCDDFLLFFGHVLTSSQRETWEEICQDFLKDTPMHRLLHGEVGSGKTVIAFLCLLYAAASGYQACLMAPTEILARQHFFSLSALSSLPIQLILGKNKRIGISDAPILIGTHALLYEKVNFSSLAMVVIDEQHRFGVMQRLKLASKGSQERFPHVLWLSATPIPRTFESLLKGFLSLSCLKRRTETCYTTSYCLSSHSIHKLEPWIKKCILRQERVYWVCPSIDQDERSVQARARALELLFPQQVIMLYGSLSAEEKEKALTVFRKGEKPILVTTTVIEVGIHVPEASTIIIEEAPLFGLSQLHQLRGRVGRDKTQGFCFFLYTPPLTPLAYERIKSLKECSDGFSIAERDWHLRGGGMPWGTEQSGRQPFRFLNPHYHRTEDSLQKIRCFWERNFSDALAFSHLFFPSMVDITKTG